MKHGHFATLYLVLYLVCFVSLWIEQEQYDQVLEEKQRIEQGLETAVEAAAWELTTVINETEKVKKQVIEESFFENLYISLGLLGEKEKQELLTMYIPMIVLAEEDGAFFYYMQNEEENGVTQLRHTWSEKNYYAFPEGITMEQRKGIAAEVLEKKASEIITNHNYIAEQYGFTYSFSVPRFLQDTSQILDFPMIFVVFQGWPLSVVRNVVYENCIDAGVYIQKQKKYVIEAPATLTQTNSYYHEASSDCFEIHGGNVLEETVSKEQATRMYGAYPCEFCVE